MRSEVDLRVSVICINYSYYLIAQGLAQEHQLALPLDFAGMAHAAPWYSAG